MFDKILMVFEVNDKVIFYNDSYHTSPNLNGFATYSFTKDKEYTVLKRGVDNYNNTYYILNNDSHEDVKIYDFHIYISPRYIREKTINIILS